MTWTARHFYRALLLSFVSLQVILIGIMMVVWTWFLVREYSLRGVLSEGPLLFAEGAFGIFLFVLLPSALHAILFVAGFILFPRLRGLWPAIVYSVGLAIAIIVVHAPDDWSILIPAAISSAGSGWIVYRYGVQVRRQRTPQ